MFKKRNTGFSTKEKDLFRQLVRNVSIGCVVTIGPDCGYIGAEFRGIVSRHGTDETIPEIFCFEPVKYSGLDRDPWNQGESFNMPVGISRAALSSDEAAPFWRKPIGLLFLSGNYSYHQLKRDFNQWEPFIVPSGILAVHEGRKTDKDARTLIEVIVSTKKYVTCEKNGGITVLRKVQVTHPHEIPSPPRMRLLIICETLYPTGGLLRFQRAGRVLKKWGHEVCFVVMSEKPKPRIKSDFPIFSFQQARRMHWDAVMVPGAGFSEEIIDRLSIFNRGNFGVRIQHILNDQSRLERFKRVNETFSPNIVIFNNTHWPIGSFTRFQADRFHFLVGGVDLQAFRPVAYQTHPLTPTCWVVGGLAQKNPDPLIESLAHLPERVRIRMFGIDAFKLSLRYKKYIDQGRLELLGILDEQGLQRFYHSVDCVVMTEKNAGWANMVAEGMASGVPVICTPHGTTAFARDKETALVIDDPTPSSIADGITLLMNDEQFCRRLAASAQKVITDGGRYGWAEYAQSLLRLIRHDGRRHYAYAPELGIYGKWPLEARMKDLYPLIERAEGMSIIDFGAAEGIVAREFLKKGAAKVHGFELDPYRVAVANAICSQWADAEFRSADLSRWETFYQAQKDLIEDRYDIVLYLGLHHHLPQNYRKDTFQHIVSLARYYIAIRTTQKTYSDDTIDEILADNGFEEVPVKRDMQPDHLGISRIFKRIEL
ncbi:MAG: glycosyltransferase [Deltaproteobacteria bacterium]|nr:glycosyltransferase [Candidatus Zymogenaceae bacterium]